MSVYEFVLGCIHRYPRLHVSVWGPQTAGWTCLVTPFSFSEGFTCLRNILKVPTIAIQAISQQLLHNFLNSLLTSVCSHLDGGQSNRITQIMELALHEYPGSSRGSALEHRSWDDSIGGNGNGTEESITESLDNPASPLPREDSLLVCCVASMISL